MLQRHAAGDQGSQGQNIGFSGPFLKVSWQAGVNPPGNRIDRQRQQLLLSFAQLQLLSIGGAGFCQENVLRDFNEMNVRHRNLSLRSEDFQHTVADKIWIVGMIEKQRVENSGTHPLRIFVNKDFMHENQTDSL